MKLQSIRLKGPDSYEKWKGYRSDMGKVQINTNAVLSQRILDICAEELVAASQEVATALTAQIIEQANPTPAITKSETS